MDLKIGFFASHGGSNVRAILDNINEGKLGVQASVVITNNSDAGVLDIARANDVPRYCLNDGKDSLGKDSLEDVILNVLGSHDVNLIVLAGYMKKIPDKIIDAYGNRILNIHPSLLPKYGGQGMYGSNVHEAVLESGDEESGATVHLVTSKYDKGRILSQRSVVVFKGDGVDDLSQRVLCLEHVMYSEVLRDIQSGLIDLDDDLV